MIWMMLAIIFCIFDCHLLYFQITINTGTITVFVPIYFLFIPDLALEEKQWHINYYSIDNIYYVDYGLNIPQ